MEMSECLDSRLFWAIILWSWCGVEVSPDGSVVLKDEDGWIRKDAKDRPIPAKQDDLRELLGLAPGMKGAVSRAIARLVEVGSIRFGNTIPGGRGAKVMYPIQEPPTKSANDGLSTGNSENAQGPWYVAHIKIELGDLPEDPVARTEAIQWIQSLGTGFNSELKVLRTSYAEAYVQGAPERGIIIEKSLKSREVKSSSSPPSSNGHKPLVVEEDEEPNIIDAEIEEPRIPVVTEVLPAVVEPVPTFDEFRAVYPGEVDPKSKPAYVKLKPPEKIACVKSLLGYRECGRWKAQGGRFIPMASRFITDEYWKFKPPDDRGPVDSKMVNLEANVNATRAFARAFRGKS